MSRTDSDRTAALELLTQFQHQILPGALRRVATWKSIPHRLLQEWLDDVVQELAVDCLQHANVIVRLPERQRHARWMRRAEAVIYRLRRHLSRLATSVDEPAVANWRHECQPDVHLPALVALSNGRPNVLASIRQSGQARRHLRQQLDDLAAQLGWHGQLEFWQARVVEALTGLAADLLLEQHGIVPVSALPLPAPERRRARLRRLGERFPVQPSTRVIRSVLRPWIRRNKHRELGARSLLEQAVALGPASGAAWLWLFEACCQERDAPGAMRAIWQARRCQGVCRATVVLARARVFELRGRFGTGIKLLRRVRRRWPREHSIGAAIAIATNDAR